MTVKHWNTGASAERYRASKQASEQKYKKIVDMVIDWLDSNIDDLYNDELDSYSDSPYKKYLASDSADLKEKIELALDDK